MSGALERAARAADPGAWLIRDKGENWQWAENRIQRSYETARAVLMAVLPTLERYDPYEHYGSYDENQSDSGPWVKFSDLKAILGEGDGE